eukprot:GHRR01026004.1.p1 GENE.GHRR01026004.1~~GHRR01026004.1.p1  ORF type:complete len:305 (+),score=91.19 GHRR01026004.1:577-1491(+)
METYMLTQYLLAENSCLSQVDSEVMKRKHGHGKRGAGGQQLRVDLSACKYELFRIVAERLGWQIVPLGSTDWDLYWTDTSICQQRLLKLSPTQRINHFHGMLELCRKRAMARSLSALAAAAAPLGISYDFCPYTWQLPGQMTAFLAAAKAAGKKATFIVKPDAGCQGKGIKLVKGGSEDKLLKSLADIAATQAVAQQYVAKPLLVNGLKFDLRVYVLVADVDPLRLVPQDGCMQCNVFCQTQYTSGICPIHTAGDACADVSKNSRDSITNCCSSCSRLGTLWLHLDNTWLPHLILHRKRGCSAP